MKIPPGLVLQKYHNKNSHYLINGMTLMKIKINGYLGKAEKLKMLIKV